MIEKASLRRLLDFFDEEDCLVLWLEVIKYALAGWTPAVGATLEVGRCSHWLRPHQNRWTANGGFAWPTGYGSGQGGHSQTALPRFDWSISMRWDGTEWRWTQRVAHEHPSLRLTLPSRTTRHEQAAVHARFQEGKSIRTEFYGFRTHPEHGWVCTADSSLVERGRGRKPKGRSVRERRSCRSRECADPVSQA